MVHELENSLNSLVFAKALDNLVCLLPCEPLSKKKNLLQSFHCDADQHSVLSFQASQKVFCHITALVEVVHLLGIPLFAKISQDVANLLANVIAVGLYQT